MERQERIKRLKEKIDAFVNAGGNIQDKKGNLPYYNYLSDTVKADKKMGIKSSIASLYAECGYAYEVKHASVTIERIKNEIEKYISSGGSIQDKKEMLTYYPLMVAYIRTKKENGIAVTIDDIYKLCGYEYEKKKLNSFDYQEIINEYKDEEGYIDRLKKEEPQTYFNLLEKAKDYDVDYNTYLMCFYGARVKDSYANVDYITLVEEGLKKFAKQYGKESVTINNLNKYNPKLYSQVRHLSIYFPQGSISQSAVLEFFGYNVNRVQEKKIDEQSVLNELNEIYKDKIVTNIRELGSIYNRLVKVSAYYDETVEQYLKRKQFIFETNSNNKVFRLSRARVEISDDLYYKIVEYRKKKLMGSSILNNDNYSEKNQLEEFRKICKQVITYRNRLVEKKTKYIK